MVLRRWLGLLLLLIGITAQALHAQDLPPQATNDANALFRRVMSPYCQGLVLADCPSGKAFELRDEIKARLAKGEKAELIEQELYRKFGDEIRTMPATHGFALGAWVFPPAFLISMTALALWAIARAHRSRPVAPVGAPLRTISPEINDRIDDELYDIR